MDVHSRLVRVVADATSPGEALAAATRVVAEELQAEGCSVYARGGSQTGLELRALFGLRPPPSGTSIAEKALAEAIPETDSALGLVAVPIASLNRGIGAIIAQRTTGVPFTTEEIMRLSGVASQLVPLVETIRFIEAIDAVGLNAGRRLETSAPLPQEGELELRGIAASPGIAIGVAVFRNAFPRAMVRSDTTYRGRALETARARDAFEKTRNDLIKLQADAASDLGEEQALIFGAHLLLLNDPLLTGLLEGGIAGGHSAAISVDDAFEEIVRRLVGVPDPYIQERIEDIEDLRSRILGHLLGAARVPDVDARIVVGPRTTASLLLELKARGAVGIVSELGGATSHGAVLARALGIPAVTGIRELTRQVVAGDLILVDGGAGTVVIRPLAATRAAFERRFRELEAERTEFVRYRDEPARTIDGVEFDLLANIALGTDLDVARENRAYGVGLYRTEFPFIVRDGLPTVDEQVRIYAKAYDAFPTEPIAFRILDLAADKFLPSMGFGASRSAFHGYRSIRVLFDYPHILRDQVQAFAMAARGRPLRILIPMVTSVDDVVRIKRLVAGALAQATPSLSTGNIVYGAMIETAAAVELVADVAREVEFFSIGTNDLIQYTLVVDRDDPRLASERHSYHPAIWRMIRRVVVEAHRSEKSVTVCGEMAAKPDLALALLAMGVDALSVTPRAIPPLKRALARMALEPLRAMRDEILALATEDEVLATLRGCSSETSKT
ncbi:Phosphoenolpyruvate-protein phosphotransferase of PTS system [Labilithrix luteola]|uniref:phosphoenolpyruvate--protein phosphotransferase n=1 Tax=Labilithrix luteola TaxID=1391654 RepID=A0A0K1QF51_9BACT|nr:phosphoenolpyruvate--protein phosphotransferase [Labilithrix luteola]AKV04065.1 Phosphoenolpyruvate-protein phosphotransferase of PTS system [Labilithrix luteola]